MRGCTIKRGSKWSIVYDVPRGEDGNRSRRWESGFRTKRQAEAALAEVLTRIEGGVYVTPTKQTVAQYLAGWLESVRPSLRPCTFTRYEQYVRLHIPPDIGRLPLAKLTPQHLQRLYADRQEAGLSPMSVRHLHAVLHKALGQAARWGVTARNSADLVTPPRGERRQMDTLSPEEARRFLEAAQGDRFHAVYALALSTGMRQGELLALRWTNVDLNKGAVQVTGTLQLTGDGFAIAETKTAKSRRQVLLTKTAIDALRQHRIAQAAARLRMGPAWTDNDLVFANEVGGFVDAGNLVRRSFFPLLKRAGIRRVRFHDLRHSAATLLLSQGVHPKIVSEMLGHSQIAITMDLYSHVTPTMQRQAAEAMDAVLGG